MHRPELGAGGARGLACALSVLVAFVLGGLRAGAQDVVPAKLTVFLDLLVEDAKGQPVRNLTPQEVVISQQGVRQQVARLVAKDAPGQYELSYVPASGRAGAVLVQLLRPGARARGLDGPALKPRVVHPLSPLETTLSQVLEARPDANDFPALASVMHFGASKEGSQHTLALEVPLKGLLAPNTGRPAGLRLQIFTRLKDAAGRVVRRFELDRALATSAQGASVMRLVWTGQAYLPGGHYQMEAVAYDPATSRASVRRVSFEATDPAPGLRLGSVALLQPLGGLVVREQGREAEDPFFLGQEPLMPTLELRTLAAPGAKVEFFTIVYPDRQSPHPVTLQMEVVRDGKVVTTGPLPLPAPDERGEIRYAGGIPTRNLPPAEYRIRLQAQQGTVGSQGEVPFTVLPSSETAPVPAGQRTSVAAPAPPAPSREAKDLDAPRALLRRHQFEDALRQLKKMDELAKGNRGDVALYLAVAYNGLGAFQDAETAVLRAIDLTKADPLQQAQATFLLGRVMAAGEKKSVRKDSERLRSAEGAFRSLLDMPGMPPETAQLALAETLIRLDRAGEARNLLSTLVQAPETTDPSRDRARQLLSSPRCATERCLPPLSFVTPDGRHQTTEDLRGKAVLLAFWATWCEPCVIALPDLKRIHSINEKGPFVMLGVNMHDERGKMDQFVEKYEIRWPQISGEASDRLIEAMAVNAIPTEVLFDHEGVAVMGTTGWRPGSSGDALFREVGSVVQKAKKQAAAKVVPAR